MIFCRLGAAFGMFRAEMMPRVSGMDRCDAASVAVIVCYIVDGTEVKSWP